MQTAPKDYTLGPLEYDSESGLPKLPEGLAWRVSRTDGDGTGVKISVVERVGDHWKSFEPNIYIYTSPTSSALKNHSTYIYTKIQEKQEQVARVESVIGLYPPNSI